MKWPSFFSRHKHKWSPWTDVSWHLERTCETCKAQEAKYSKQLIQDRFIESIVKISVEAGENILKEYFKVGSTVNSLPFVQWNQTLNCPKCNAPITIFPQFSSQYQQTFKVNHFTGKEIE